MIDYTGTTRNLRHTLPDPISQSFGGTGPNGFDPRLFGGTGSTVVNTKLKDHVFNAILKKFRKHAMEKFGETHTEGEGEHLDATDHVLGNGGGGGRHGQHRKLSPRGIDPTSSSHTRLNLLAVGSPSLRRVQSEAAIPSAKRMTEMSADGMRAPRGRHVPPTTRESNLRMGDDEGVHTIETQSKRSSSPELRAGDKRQPDPGRAHLLSSSVGEAEGKVGHIPSPVLP
jgi:hypothetical protein